MGLDAANDAHASLALYHALRRVHARSVAEGVIPVGNPPPWARENSSTTPTSTTTTPAPPPFVAKAAPTTDPIPNPTPTSELQNLTPVQLDSLLPWPTLIFDLRAEMEDTRNAVKAKRAEEGVDVKGRGEAVVAAEAEAAAAEVARGSKPVVKSRAATKPRTVSASSVTAGAKPIPAAPASALATEATKTSTSGNQVAPTDIEAAPQTLDEVGLTIQNNTSVELAEDSTAPAPSKGMTRVLERRRAVEETRNEIMGKRWPPVRTAPSWATPLVSSPFLTSALGGSGGLSPSTSRAPLSEEAPRLPSSVVRPAVPTRHATDPVPISASVAQQQQPSSEQLRAYLLWHNRQLSLAHICTTMRSAKRPLTKVTVM